MAAGPRGRCDVGVVEIAMRRGCWNAADGELQARLRLQILSCQMRLAMVQANRTSEADVRRMRCDAMLGHRERRQQHSTDRQRREMRCEARRRRGREADERLRFPSPVFQRPSRTAKEQLKEQSPHV
jgi:hypothetical protein